LGERERKSEMDLRGKVVVMPGNGSKMMRMKIGDEDLSEGSDLNGPKLIKKLSFWVNLLTTSGCHPASLLLYTSFYVPL
jgi:hypothetical protein